MRDSRFWQQLLAIGLLAFWLIMLPVFLITGERALGNCLSNLTSFDFSGCLSSLAAAGASYVILKWGTILLLAGFVIATLFRIIGDRRSGNGPTGSNEPLPPGPSGPF